MSNQTTDTPEDPQASAGSPQQPAEGPEVPEAPQEATEGQQEPQEDDDGNREAARYRRRLRDTEADRDRLAVQVEALQRAEVDRLADKVHNVKPEALWASGATLAEMLTAAGTVDPTKVAVAANAAEQTLGLNRRRGNRVPSEGRQTAYRPTPPKPTFADAFTTTAWSDGPA
ncbi:hypothetical protein ACFV9G_13610 [Nocardioides sp. NPDC059952]|uniref:hypothetical protein n=1 Tax=Nocardioides sp. NPDC059952 TaxID=3347014 RepID=UPI003654871E